MTAYPHNVTISGKSPWPWAPRWVHVEEEEYLKINRSFSLQWGKLIAKDTSCNVIFTLNKRRFSSIYDLKDRQGAAVCLRRQHLGHWTCESPDWVMEVYRLSGSKCVLTKNGSQVAIMSVNPGLSFLNSHKIHLRVNEAPYLHISIALALLIDDFSLHVNTTLFQKPEVSTLQPG